VNTTPTRKKGRKVTQFWGCWFSPSIVTRIISFLF